MQTRRRRRLHGIAQFVPVADGNGVDLFPEGRGSRRGSDRKGSHGQTVNPGNRQNQEQTSARATAIHFRIDPREISIANVGFEPGVVKSDSSTGRPGRTDPFPRTTSNTNPPTDPGNTVPPGRASPGHSEGFAEN